ncbi:MAG: hypothetical protein JJ975_15940 [Bacteroidia bacterium]|nr:hypothetical protein [Bacteroidia bacterium]
MNKSFANLISLVFHPIFVPILGVLAIANFHLIVAAKLNAQPKVMLVFMFALVLSVMPLMGVMFLLKKYNIKELSAISMEERSRAAFSLFVIYAFVAWRFDGFFVHSILKLFVVALALSSVVLAVVSRYKKVSFHVFGWAGMLVLMFVLAQTNGESFVFWVLTTLLVTGIVATARLRLNAHNHSEVYWGFFLGLICNIAVYLILNGRL